MAHIPRSSHGTSSKHSARPTAEQQCCQKTEVVYLKAGDRVCPLAGDDGLDGGSLGQTAVLALQLKVKVLDGMLVPLDRFQVGHLVAQTPHLLPLQQPATLHQLRSLVSIWQSRSRAWLTSAAEPYKHLTVLHSCMNLGFS
jgi:hypothetical protein